MLRSRCSFATHARRWSGILAFSAAFLVAGGSVVAGSRDYPAILAINDGTGQVQAAMAAQEVEFDQQFVDMMVPHHEGAVEMARIALQRTQRPEILNLATDILRTQDAEIEAMRGWREAWYGSRGTPTMSAMPMLHSPAAAGMMAMTMDMAQDVELLRNAPEPFDRAFIDAMIPHHQSAIEAARLAEQYAVHQEIKDLARQILVDQQREIDQMQAWRQSWYPAEPAPPAPQHAPGMQH